MPTAQHDLNSVYQLLGELKTGVSNLKETCANLLRLHELSDEKAAKYRSDMLHSMAEVNQKVDPLIAGQRASAMEIRAIEVTIGSMSKNLSETSSNVDILSQKANDYDNKISKLGELVSAHEKDRQSVYRWAKGGRWVSRALWASAISLMLLFADKLRGPWEKIISLWK